MQYEPQDVIPIKSKNGLVHIQTTRPDHIEQDLDMADENKKYQDSVKSLIGEGIKSVHSGDMVPEFEGPIRGFSSKSEGIDLTISFDKPTYTLVPQIIHICTEGFLQVVVERGEDGDCIVAIETGVNTHNVDAICEAISKAVKMTRID